MIRHDQALLRIIVQYLFGNIAVVAFLFAGPGATICLRCYYLPASGPRWLVHPMNHGAS